jgi:hypothetical protein
MFRVGQKVVLIRAISGPPINGDVFPTVGQVYSIRDILFEDGQSWLRLNEIINRVINEIDECCFIAAKFRPLVERKTDISVFTKMLRPADTTVDA